VQVLGDGNVLPPANALIARGLANNLESYSLYADYVKGHPQAQLVWAVAEGEVDAAIAWGPAVGHFAGRHEEHLDVRPIAAAANLDGTPLQFDISIAVRKGMEELRDEVDVVLAKRQRDIKRLLDNYYVPRVSRSTALQTAPAAEADR
jgi:mxaJ protein